MPSALIYITGNNRITHADFSCDPVAKGYVGRNDVMIFDDQTSPMTETQVKALFSTVPQKYIKRVQDFQVAEMDSGEKATVDSEIVADILAGQRGEASATLDSHEFLGKLMRCFADIVKDEINLLRERDRDRSVDIAAATSLADLKTRWAARSSTRITESRCGAGPSRGSIST